MRFNLFLSTFLSLFLSFDLFSQKPSLIFNNLGLNDGLSQSTVRAIAEDKSGFMWFGTEDGLNKYDAYVFTVYRPIPFDKYSISSSNIRNSYTDSKGNLWIMTRGGLNLYDPLKDRFYNYKSETYPVFQNLRNQVEDLAEDNKGNLWLAAEKEGLYKIESIYSTPEKFSYSPKENIGKMVSVESDNRGNLWIGTWDGLLKFNIRKKEFTDLRTIYGRGYQVNNIYFDAKGFLWISSTHGLKIINTATGNIKEYFHNDEDYESINGNNVLKAIPYKDGNFLIAMDGTGIDYFNIKTKKFSHFTHENTAQLSSNNITSFYKDSKGDLWAGAFINGVNFSNPTTNLFALVPNNPYSDRGIKNGIITSFLKDMNGSFWVSTDGGGLYIRPQGKNEFLNFKTSKQHKGPSSDAVISLLEDVAGKVWLATYGGGLNLFLPEDSVFKVFKHDPSNPASICNNKLKCLTQYEGKLWIGSYGTGISVLDKDSGKFKHYAEDKSDLTSIPSDWIQKIFKDREGNLWIGTFNGLCKYLPETDNFKTYLFDKANTLGDKNFINDIFEDSQGHLWIATSGGLVSFNSHEETFYIYTTDNGLSHNTIASILEDDRSNLWLATGNGLTRFNTASKRGIPYTIKDGAPSSTFFLDSKFKDESGKLYFGTNRGYLIIDPLMSAKNNFIPPIVLTEIKIAHSVVHAGGKDSTLAKHINQTKKLSLTYDQNAFTIEFAALNYNNSKKNKYAFKLEGFDLAWNYVEDQRTATYTNLNPGSYIFRVKGSNNDDIWNKEGTFIEITIIPPWWKTWWFITIEIISSCLFLYLLYWFRIKSIRNKNFLLEDIVQKRTEELHQSNERLETFIYKASHDIKGPLKSIIGLTNIGEKDVNDPVALNYFKHINKSTKKLDVLLSDLLQLTKVKQVIIQKEKINFREMISEAMSSFEHLPGYEKMKFNIDINQNLDFYSDKKLLSSIIQNLIENPIKYKDESKKECRLDIKVKVKNAEEADLTFSDNGLGIPEESQTKIFDMFYKVNESSFGTGLGLYIVKTTVEKLEGTIRLESKSGIGSTFYINFKKGDAPSFKKKIM
jgi:two-component system, sensor histidine kinase ChiS